MNKQHSTEFLFLNGQTTFYCGEQLAVTAALEIAAAATATAAASGALASASNHRVCI
jgi:hypothetical protein